MTKTEKIIANIIMIEPLIYGLQDKIEREQENVIADRVSPAEKVVARLIALDNRRIDLCNLKVLYGYMERDLGEKFSILKVCAQTGAECALYAEAEKTLEDAGYDCSRSASEFGYLFKALDAKKRKKRVTAVGTPQSESKTYSSAATG